MNEAKQYLIQENKIVFSGSTISFDFPIQESIEINNMLIVCIDFKNNTIEENVFGISVIEEEVKWQIEKKRYPARQGSPSCPFVGISYYDNKLKLFNWCDRAFIVEPSTGKILEEYEIR